MYSVDEEQVKKICTIIRDKQIDSIAITGIHSHINPSHEIKVLQVINKILPNVLFLSSHLHTLLNEGICHFVSQGGQTWST